MKRLIIIGVLIMCGISITHGKEYKSSAKCVELIKHFEKFSPIAYYDSNGYSIGYGRHYNVRKGDKITHSKALQYLKEDIKIAEGYVNYLLNKLPYNYNFSQHFIDGLTSLVYNAGVGNVEKSTFYKRLSACRVKNGVINSGDFEFTLASIKNSCVSAKGHIERRKHEYNMMRGK